MFDFDIVDACVLFDPCTISRARLAEQDVDPQVAAGERVATEVVDDNGDDGQRAQSIDFGSIGR